MRKTYINKLFAIAFFMMLFAQNIEAQDNYQPLVKEGKRWEARVPWLYNDTIDYVCYIEGDTVINSKDYFKVYEINPIQYSDNNIHYLEAIKEVNQKVFVVLPEHDYEILLFDFSKRQVGDSIFDEEAESGFKLVNFYEKYIYSMGSSRDVYEYEYALKNTDVTSAPYIPYLVEGIGWNGVPFLTYKFNTVITGADFRVFEDDICVYDSSRSYDRETGIANANGDNPKLIIFYDLQGRKLSQKPQKGIYIENGKKKVVR